MIQSSKKQKISNEQDVTSLDYLVVMLPPKYKMKEGAKNEADRIVNCILDDIGARSYYTGLLKILKNIDPSTFTPKDLANLMDSICGDTQNTLFINTDMAMSIRDILLTKFSDLYGNDRYKFQHIICSRVLDAWRLDDRFGGCGECYYTINYILDPNAISIIEGIRPRHTRFISDNLIKDEYFKTLIKSLFTFCSACKTIKDLLKNKLCRSCHWNKIRLMYIWIKQTNKIPKDVLKIIINFSLC